MNRERLIDRATRRTKRYWYEDGLAELAGGVLFALIGLLFYLEYAAPALAGFSAIGLPLLVIGGAGLARWAVGKAKERLTYPRTGYVAYSRQGGARSRVASGAVAAVLGIATSLLIVNAPAALAWIPALQGLAIGAGLFYWGHSIGLGRFYLLAAFSGLVGLSAARAGLGDLAGSAAYFVFMGFALVASGAFTLWNYLRLTEPLGE